MVLLVTSRTRRRWIIPKGNIPPRMLARRAAEREAFEEAGILGRISHETVGSYRQGDELSVGAGGGIMVDAFALEVTDEIPVWQEMHRRDRRWFALKEALKVVRDPELRRLLQSFGRWVQPPDDGDDVPAG